MTVAALIMVPDPTAALGDAEGEPILRRVAQAAWSGGALPILAVCLRPTEELRAVVTDLAVGFAAPASDEPHGIAWFAAGMRAAAADVTGTTAALLWPFRFAWLDPETITSLVEAHGASPEWILRPAYAGRPGFPILIPMSLQPRLALLSGRGGEDAVAELVAAGVPYRQIDLGDPGIAIDIATPRASLPDYQGPTGPAGGPPPDWNADLAAHAADPETDPALR
jgi:CTP:molybdopterin cytidylyltransferase MocA